MNDYNDRSTLKTRYSETKQTVLLKLEIQLSIDEIIMLYINTLTLSVCLSGSVPVCLYTPVSSTPDSPTFGLEVPFSLLN